MHTAGVTNNENRRIMVDDLRIREWCQVRTAAILRPCAYEADWARNDRRDEQLVVERCGPAVLVGIDIHMLMLQTLSSVVRALAWLPVRLLRFCESPLLLCPPIWSPRFYVFEVAMWVALDVLPDQIFVRSYPPTAFTCTYSLSIICSCAAGSCFLCS